MDRVAAVFIAFVLCLAAAPPAPAASAIACHCFRDRSFDPARPAAADPYVLATSQSSLIASAFGAEKKDLVQARMTGTPGADLWVAHFAAARAGLKAADLLALRARSASWTEALAVAAGGPGRFPGTFGALLARATADDALASAAVDAVLAERLGAAPEAVAALRAAGASDPEAVAAVLLGRLRERPGSAPLAEVRAGRATWGELFQRAGVAPSAIGDAVARLVQ